MSGWPTFGGNGTLEIAYLPRKLLFVIENFNIRDAFRVDSVLIELRAAVS